MEDNDMGNTPNIFRRQRVENEVEEEERIEEEEEEKEEEEGNVSTDSSSDPRTPLTYHVLLDRDHNGYIIHSNSYLTNDDIDDDIDDDDDDSSYAYQILARLLGANLRRRFHKPYNTLQKEDQKVEVTPMDPSCDLYSELVESKRSTHINRQLRTLQYNRDIPSVAEQTVTSSHYLPRHYCLASAFDARVFCGIYSPDGNVFMCACQDNNLYLYNTEGSQFSCYKVVTGRDIGWSVSSIDFSPDQNWFIYSTWSPYIHLCNVYEEEERHYSLDLRPDLDNHFCAFAAKFSGDDKEILASANDGNLYIYDREKQDRILIIDAHQDDANATSFADSSGQIIYSGGDDGLCKVWDRRCLNEVSPQPVGIFAGHKDGITFIDSKEDGRYLITNCKDQTIKLWDTRCFATTEGIDSTLHSTATQSWDYRWQNVSRKIQRERTTKLKGDVSVMTYAGHTVRNTLIRCRFSPQATTGQRYIYTGCATGQVIIYDIITGEIVSSLKSDCCSPVRDVCWHPNQVSTLTASTWDGTILLWDYNQRQDYCTRSARDSYYNYL